METTNKRSYTYVCSCMSFAKKQIVEASARVGTHDDKKIKNKSSLGMPPLLSTSYFIHNVF